MKKIINYENELCLIESVAPRNLKKAAAGELAKVWFLEVSRRQCIYFHSSQTQKCGSIYSYKPKFWINLGHRLSISARRTGKIGTGSNSSRKTQKFGVWRKVKEKRCQTSGLQPVGDLN